MSNPFTQDQATTRGAVDTSQPMVLGRVSRDGGTMLMVRMPGGGVDYIPDIPGVEVGSRVPTTSSEMLLAGDEDTISPVSISTSGTLSPVSGTSERAAAVDQRGEASRGQMSAPTTYGGSSRRDVATDVYNAFRRQGLSHNQAAALTAEINREGSMDPNNLFGRHSDPHNRATNVGMLSWQKDRAERLLEFMSGRGLLDAQGNMLPTQESLDAQAEYLLWEMENLPEYQRTRDQFLSNPDIDFDTAHRVLGDNFIRWRRTDPEYRDSGYGRINEGYALLTGETDGITPSLFDRTDPNMPASATRGIRPEARPEREQEEARSWLDTLTDDLPEALQYLELQAQEDARARTPQIQRAPTPLGTQRGRSGQSGTQALQRLGIGSLA